MLKREDPVQADFEDFYSKEDPWSIRSSALERDRIAKLNQVFRHCRFRNGLDIGCGEGDVLHALSFIEHKTGVDIAENALARARLRYPDIDFRQGDFSRIETLPNGPFDFISCLESLYYLGSDAARDRAVSDMSSLGTADCVFLFSLVIVGENMFRRYFTLDSALETLTRHLNVLYYFPTRLALTARLSRLRYRLLPQARRLARLSPERVCEAYQCAFVCVRRLAALH